MTQVTPHFETALSREILISEQRRVLLLAGVISAGLLLYLTAFAFFPTVIEQLFRGRMTPATLLSILLPTIAYEFLAYRLFGYFAQRGQAPPFFGRYANAFIETSFPSVLIIVVAHIVDPIYALVLPPFLFYFIFIILSALRLDFRLSVFTGLVAAVEYSALAQLYLAQAPVENYELLLVTPFQHFGKSIVLLLCGILAGLVAYRIKQQFINSLRSVEDRNHILTVFGQHVSPEVVERLLTQNVAIEGETRQVCMMFLDIRDFTAFSEQRRPEEVVRYLNSLFDFMIASVNQHHGVVNKFLGDGFMAVFGAPIDDDRHIRNAVAAAREIIARVDELNASHTIPLTRIGIGLHAGEAVTGNVGSAQRREYTIIGDVVNLASRIEQLNKQFGSRLLVSETVWAELNPAESADSKPLGLVPVKGHVQPVQVYQLA